MSKVIFIYLFDYAFICIICSWEKKSQWLSKFLWLILRVAVRMIVKCNYYSNLPPHIAQILESIWQVYKTGTHILKYLSIKGGSFKNQFYINLTLF